MAATQTVSQLPHVRNSNKKPSISQLPAPAREPRATLTPRHGVITLFGYGIGVRVDRGHLTVEDGIGTDRRQARFARVGHGLRRLVVIGSDGVVSLAALRWLADQDAAFVMLERDGSVLATTGPVRPSDSRLRRAQALAHQSGGALRIVRELVGQKLDGQELLVREGLNDVVAAEKIAQARVAVAKADTIPAARSLEALAGHAYWSAWHSVVVNFPRIDLLRVPDHWRTFGTRLSPLSGSPRLAVNPANAILNYLYALLESETRLAAAAMGLDPGIGILHVDRDARDSLACDLMEPVRPQVDAYLLNWLTREPLRREWFFEQRDGNCRVMAALAVRLSETALTWGRQVAPVAEWVAHALWSSIRKPLGQAGPATRLTQRRKREAKGSPSDQPNRPAPRPPAVCRVCGSPVGTRGVKYCGDCAGKVAKENLIEAAKLGRAATHGPEAEALRAQTQRRQAARLKAWDPSDKPDWLDERAYNEKIQPRLAALPVSAICSAVGISAPYATDIREGRRQPHPRHWQALAQLVGISEH